ncbi:MAG TPA: RES family NAD+ phosphorylase [Chloroflexota bacterium]|nr:RES family NAD+ phosphorylase [Chloroflexota bacterium]
MPKLPLPPPVSDLARIPPAWHVVPAGTILYRIYFRGGSYPGVWNQLRYYGPTSARFDHHESPPRVQVRGVLYAANHPRTSLAEVFQARRTINARRDEPWLAGFRPATDIRLLDLTGLWPTRAGASMAINSGLRSTARRWSGAIYQVYPDADGLWYGSSMNANAPCVALYERAITALPARPSFHRALADDTLRAFLETCAELLGYRLVL